MILTTSEESRLLDQRAMTEYGLPESVLMENAGASVVQLMKEKISWEETTVRINSKTDADVRRALSKEHCDVEDFMALISPAAVPYLETMARLSKKYTEERFGKTISMFVPLYITNSCTNSCVYCGFHISNPMPRTILTEEEIVNEYKAIKKLAPFENLLLVTGENPAKAGVPYIARALDLAKPYFSNLKIEVMPLKAEEYAEKSEALGDERAAVWKARIEAVKNGK